MMQQFLSNSYLFGGFVLFVVVLFVVYLNNPGSVPDNWRAYFDAMQHVPAVDGSAKPDVAHAPVVASFAERAKQGPIRTVTASRDAEMGRKRGAVTQLIAAYRFLGTHWANLDPLKRQERPVIQELEPGFYGFSDVDMDTVFNISNTYFGTETASLRDLVNSLRDTYCRSIGAEFMHMSDPAQKRWMQERLESTRATPNFAPEKKKDKKKNKNNKTQHGRLNEQNKTQNKMPQELFAEFEGRHADDLPAGDVKYHQGFFSDDSTPGGPVHLSFAFNSSHLEIVYPVVEGSVKAR